MKRTHKPPQELTEQRRRQLRREAAARRKALNDAGCKTYQIGSRDGQEAIMCLCCGLGSHNRNDVVQRYCGFCQAFHDPLGDPHYAALVDLQAQLQEIENELQKLPPSDDPAYLSPAEEKLLQRAEATEQRIRDFRLPIHLEFATFHEEPPDDSVILLLIIHHMHECEWRTCAIYGQEIQDPYDHFHVLGTFDDARKHGWRWAELPALLAD